MSTSQIEITLSQSTIVAPASGPGPSGVAIIRISGPEAGQALQSLAGPLPTPRTATLRALRDRDGEKIDKALVLWFPAPGSFTGEDVAEFHVHGGRAIVSDVIEACIATANVGLAKPGDFTRRAFENGKMDLSAAEGLGDLIDAETQAQRRQALRQMEGELANEVVAWRDEIIDALATAEGDIDFPDEDLPRGLSARAHTQITQLHCKLAQHLVESQHAIRIRDGFRVAILGVPNAGKSSLLNVLVRREAAIVSPIPGTTRDIVEVRMVLAGMVVLLADTAGLRVAGDQIEAIGISRALDQAKAADLRIGVVASRDEQMQLAHLLGPEDIWVLAKADIQGWTVNEKNEILVSSVTGLGIDILEAAIISGATQDLITSENAPLTRLRHQDAVRNTIAALERAQNSHTDAPELIAEDLRLATRSLGQIIGHVDMEDVLDRVFSKFCIGK